MQAFLSGQNFLLIQDIPSDNVHISHIGNTGCLMGLEKMFRRCSGDTHCGGDHAACTGNTEHLLGLENVVLALAGLLVSAPHTY